jgi:hypothetical protein
LVFARIFFVVLVFLMSSLFRKVLPT